ncbi:MAG TPA: hypothetical protein VHS96_06610 [Bacteroidia bacterium]|nr:hypothetical protein [Bacteroidia bacterium]
MFSPALSLFVGLLRFNRLGKGQHIICILAVFYLLNQSVAEWVGSKNISNYPFFHLSIVVEFSLLSWAFVAEQGVLFNRKFLMISIATFFLGSVLNAVWGEGLENAPSILLVVESCFLIVLVGAYFLKVYRQMTVMRIEQEFLFWLSMGILVFFVGTILLSIFIEFITESEELFFDIFLIRASLIILTNICYAIAMLCKAHPQKS